MCLTFQAVCHKLYGDLQSLSIPTHLWKNLSINFVTSFLILTNWKDNSYNSILVIINHQTKMIYYKPVKVTINILGLEKVIINAVVCHHGVSKSIVMDWDLLFISIFWSLLYYFLGIKQKLSTTLYPQTNGHKKRQNSKIKVYFWAFVNCK